MEYFTAATYESWTRVGEPYEKSGKLYSTIKRKCDRCTKGVFVCRVENGQPIPHPAYGGVCLKCGGKGYLTKDVRLYTQKEREQMDKRNEKAREKKAAEQEARIKAEYAQKKAKWLQDNGFNAEGETYIVTGDSYSIKDELKEAGFRFSGALKRWMRGTNEGYEDKTEKFTTDQLVDFSAWGTGEYKSDAKDLVDEALRANDPVPASEYVGEIKDRLTLTVTLVRKGGYEGCYGHSNIYTFQDENESVFTWFSSVYIDKEIGDTFSIVGTVKDHKEYNGVKQTVLTRCKVVGD